MSNDKDNSILNPDSTPENFGTKRVNKRLLIGISVSGIVIFTVVLFYSLNQSNNSGGQEQDAQKIISAANQADKFIPKDLGWVNPKSASVAGPIPQIHAQPTLSADNHLATMEHSRIKALEAAIGSDISIEVDAKSSRRESLQSDEMQRKQTKDMDGQNKKQKRSGFDAEFESNLDWDSHSSLENPTKFMLRTGSVIPGVLLSGINSELPGKILAQVAQDVYDSPTGQYLLIPKGSRLLGEYSSSVAYGQSRVLVVWQRIVYPDGRALDIGVQPGADAEGYGGFKDRVDSHWFRIFGSAILMSAVVGGVSISQQVGQNNLGSFVGPNGFFNSVNMPQTLSQSLGTVFGNLIVKMLEKNMDIAPTLKIRKGYRFNILVIKDFDLVPYQAYRYSAS